MERHATVEMRAIEDRHWWFRGRRAVLAADVLAAHAAAPPGPLVDLGCGTGGNLAWLRRLVPGRRAVGVDRDDETLRLAATRGLDAALVRADAQRLPLAEAGAAVVVALDLLEHCADDGALLREVFRALRPGGQLVVSVPAHPRLWSEHDVALHHLRRYAAGELEERVRAAGLEVVDRHGFNFLLLPVVAGARLLRGAPRGGEPARTDFFHVPGPVNAALAGVLSLERAVLSVARVPFGVSRVLRARRP